MAENEQVDCPNNVQLFRIAVSNNLKNIAESVSEDEFIETLTILKANPGISRKLHKAMMKELYGSMNDDLEDMLKEGSLQSAFKRVARLSEECAPSSAEAWRPPGDVAEHMRSLDAYKMKEAIEELEVLVNGMEEENETLMNTITESRSRIRASSDAVKRSLARAPVVLQRLQKTREQLADCLKTIENE